MSEKSTNSNVKSYNITNITSKFKGMFLSVRSTLLL